MDIPGRANCCAKALRQGCGQGDRSRVQGEQLEMGTEEAHAQECLADPAEASQRVRPPRSSRHRLWAEICSL